MTEEQLAEQLNTINTNIFARAINMAEFNESSELPVEVGGDAAETAKK